MLLGGSWATMLPLKQAAKLLLFPAPGALPEVAVQLVIVLEASLCVKMVPLFHKLRSLVALFSKSATKLVWPLTVAVGEGEGVIEGVAEGKILVGVADGKTLLGVA